MGKCNHGSSKGTGIQIYLVNAEITKCFANKEVMSIAMVTSLLPQQFPEAAKNSLLGNKSAGVLGTDSIVVNNN